MQVGQISDQWVMQVFVVEFVVCGGRGGLMSGGLERWSASECLGVVWKDVVSSGGGNCRVGSVGFTVGVSSDLRVIWDGFKGGMVVGWWRMKAGCWVDLREQFGEV